MIWYRQGTGHRRATVVLGGAASRCAHFDSGCAPGEVEVSCGPPGGWLLEDNRRATTADREMIGIVVIQHSLTSSPGHRVRALASCEIEAHSTSRYTMLLHELPIDVPVLPLLGTTGLARLEQTCKAFKDVCRSDSALMTAWKEAVRSRWGPVRLPDSCRSWRELAQELEVRVRPDFSRRVRTAVETLKATYLSDGASWHESLRCCLLDEGFSLSEKRRIVAFVCADWQSSDTLATFLKPFPIRGETPEDALRALLLVFPFLPIDAGVGADAVIGYFARAYASANPQALARLGVHMAACDEEVEVANRPLTPAVRLARDFTYTLVYSIIMLNTDLHNPAIHPKITQQEYAASCRRCIPLAHLDDAFLFELYARIRDRPLAISPTGDPVKTSVRSSSSGFEIESHATYSIYSTIASSHLGILSLQSARADVPAATTSRRGAGGVQSSSIPVRNTVTVDWSVAYWNIVDGCRYARAAAWRRLTRPFEYLAAIDVGAVALATSLVVGLALAIRLGAALREAPA